MKVIIVKIIENVPKISEYSIVLNANQLEHLKT